MKGLLMAVAFPTLENIQRLKVPPTNGEWYLLNYLIENLSSDIEIYFQPFLNGDRPDIILMQKNVGVTIIEVKDYNLSSYSITEDNKWHLNYDGRTIKSPFQQVYYYKNNLFDLHINGLLEQKLKNDAFYGRIKPYVYFYNSDKQQIENLYSSALKSCKELKEKCNIDYSNKDISYEKYDFELQSIDKNLKRIKRDMNLVCVANDSLKKISMPEAKSELFTNNIYEEFKRYLQPPYHTIAEGKDIPYTKTQIKLSDSHSEHTKIKGVAGSGKTTVIAKRAVNAHKRHGDVVLILTFNISLINYLHDKISDVREGFNWKYFHINNYHSFFKAAVSNTEMEVNFADFSIYEDVSIFEGYENEIFKYSTILIDEVQDYQSEWIKIIRKYFLHDDGEIVLFGDEKQNIYERSLDQEKRIVVPNGFSRWKSLNTSIRHQGDGGRILDLTKKFQQAFFINKYIIDEDEKLPTQAFFNLGIFSLTNIDSLWDENNKVNKKTITTLTEDIFKHIKENKIHPNDICVLSSQVDLLREVDYHIRTSLNEKTMTTFETKERYESEQVKHNKKSKNFQILLEKIRRNKKKHFHSNSGVLKISTIHSFKGLEAPTVFMIIDEKDKEEIVYTGITRSQFNIMVYLPKDNKFNEFFSNELKIENSESDSKKMIFEMLKESVSMKKIISFDYKINNKSIRQIDIKPYKILFMNDNYYLASEVNNEYKFSMFRISKISNIQDSEKSFYYNVDIQNFISDIQTPFSTYKEDYKSHQIVVKVEVDKSKAHFFEDKKFLPSQIIEKKLDNGNLQISYIVTQEMEAEELIKKWIPFMRVMEPIRLDEKIRSDMRKYLSN